MKIDSHQTSERFLSIDRLAHAAFGAVLLITAAYAQSDTIYRVIDASGRVTFSDKAPATSDNATAMTPGGRQVSVGGSALPGELREVVSKFPVILYTASSCAPCSSGSKLLSSRGVPFTEKTVNTNEDSEALRRISGENTLPLLTIGGQQIKGYSDSEWTQFLDAAGYPKISVLPANYLGPPATPLVVVQKAAPAAKPDESFAPRGLPEASQPANDSAANPAGIKF